MISGMRYLKGEGKIKAGEIFKKGQQQNSKSSETTFFIKKITKKTSSIRQDDKVSSTGQTARKQMPGRRRNKLAKDALPVVG